MQLILIIEDHRRDAHRRTESATAAPARRRHVVRTGQILTVGRDPVLSDILVESDEAMSATHFQVSCSAEGCRLTDLGSRHGTLVNGQRVEQSELRDDDHILAGHTRIVVQLLHHASRTAADVGIATVRAAPRMPALPGVNPQGAESADKTGGSVDRQLRLQLQMIHLQEGQNRSHATQLFTTILPGEKVIVGRVPEKSDLSFPGDNEMSGAHMEFTCSRRDCRLKDLNSTNGTFLNGQQMHNLLLQDGDEIRCGRTWFIVNLDADQTVRRSLVHQTVEDIAVSQSLRRQARQGPGGFRIVNTTPFKLAPVTGQIGFPGHSLTLVVRSTFQLKPGEKAVAVEEQSFPGGDVPFEGEDDPVKPPRYEGDFAFLKPRADLLLAGHCYAPQQKPVGRVKAGLQVGKHACWLEVFGKRRWVQERGAWKATDPEPFTSVEITYANSFGGPGFDANPSGTGHSIARQRRADVPLPLPQIEWPEALLKSPDDVAEPAGFGPLGKWYGRRRKQLGTYDKSWEQKQFPWFPEDFKWEHFNAAPEALQINGFLHGDETITLTNLHPEHPEYRTQLPGIRVRCFVNLLGKGFCEVPAHADTLWIDADAEQAVLVWRGHTSVTSEDCEDVRHILVISQFVDEVPLSLNDCHAILLNELTDEEAEFDPPPENPPDEPEEEAAEGGSNSPEEVAAAEQTRKFEQELAQVQAKIRETQLAAGVDPELFDQQVKAEEARLLREWGADSDVPPAILASRVNAEYTRLRTQIHEAQVAAGHEPVAMPDALIDIPREPAQDENDDTEGSEWTRQRVASHHADGGSFAGEDLSLLDLTDLDLSGADFEAAVLTGTRFCRSQLSGARMTLASLSDADLSGTQLKKAVLDHADLTGAILHQAVLDDASALGAIFEGAWLTGASLQRMNAAGAFFGEADLTDTNLNSARLDGAVFENARMARADFRNASMIEASLEAVTGHKACFEKADLTKIRAAGCDLSGSSLIQIQANESIWENAILNFADFSYSRMLGANLIKSNLENARLFAADLSGSRLTKASLKAATMTDMNLFEAGLMQADLTDADISRSNLYGAELLGVNWSETRRDNVNWKMTKLADEMLTKGQGA